FPKGRRCCRDWQDPRSPGSPPPGPWDRNDKCRNITSRFAKPNAGQTLRVGWSPAVRPNFLPALLLRALEQRLQLPRLGRPALEFEQSLPPTCKRSHCQEMYNVIQTLPSKV